MDKIPDEEREFLTEAFTEALDNLNSEAQRALFFGVHAKDEETDEPYATPDSEAGEFLKECLAEALLKWVRKTEREASIGEAQDRWETAYKAGYGR